jgi:hypothetical protein
MFDINRICQLAGLEAPAGSNIIRESKAPVARKSLNESAKSESDVVYEMDDRELMAEAKRAEKNLVEHDFRMAVREEIGQILNNLEHGSRWIYGTKENQPQNSKMGQITRGGLGIGFK